MTSFCPQDSTRTPLCPQDSTGNPLLSSGFPHPGDLPDPEIKAMFPASPALQKDSLPTESPGKPAVLLIL